MATRSLPPALWDSLEDVPGVVENRLGGRVRDLRLRVSTRHPMLLEGRADTYYSRQLAYRLALEALGGEEGELTNEIQVR